MAKKLQPSNPFTEIKSAYHLTTPAQIKLRIIWQHVQALTLKVHGNTPENVSKLKRYDRAFGLAEQAESKPK